MGVDTLELDYRDHRRTARSSSPNGCAGLNPDLARDASGRLCRGTRHSPLSGCGLRRFRKYDVGQDQARQRLCCAIPPNRRAVAGKRRSPTLKRSPRSRAQVGATAHVRLNIETKDRSEPSGKEIPRTRPRFRHAAARSILVAEKFTDRAMVQSFDWRTLRFVAEARAFDSHRLSELAEGQGGRRYFWTRPRTGRQVSIPLDYGGSLPRCDQGPAGPARSGSPYFGDCKSPRLISESHRAWTSRFVVWTVNRPEDHGRR